MKMINSGLLQKRHKELYKPMNCEVEQVASLGLKDMAAPFVMLAGVGVAAVLALAAEWGVRGRNVGCVGG